MKVESSVKVLTGNLGFDRVTRAQRHRHELTNASIAGCNSVEPQLLWCDNVVLDGLLLFLRRRIMMAPLSPVGSPETAFTPPTKT